MSDLTLDEQDELELAEAEAAAAKAKGTPTAQAPASGPSKLDAAMSWLKSNMPATVGLMPLPDMSKPRIGFSAVPTDEQGVASTLQGALQGLAPRAVAAVTGEPLEDARRYFNAAEAARPEESLSGAAMLPIPGPKGTGVLPALGRIGIGAGLGALNAEERAPEAEAFDSGKHGAELAAGVGAAAEALPVVGRMAPALRRIAETNALKAAFGGGQISNKLAKRGYGTEQEALGLGREMLDRGLVPWFGSSAKAAEAAKAEAGTHIEGALTKAAASGVPFDADRAAWSAVANMEGPRGSNALEAANSAKGVGLAQAMADEGARGLPPEETWREANRLKSQAWGGANFTDDAPLAAQQYRKAVAGLRNSIGAQVGEVAGPQTAEQLQKANADFGIASDVYDMAKDVDTRELAKKSRVPQVIGGALGAAAGALSLGGAGAAGGAGAGMFAGPLVADLVAGPNRLARGANAAAKVAGTLPQRSIGTPAATSAAARKLWEWYGVAPKDDEDISRTHADKQLPGL